jgi:ribosomal protein S20
MKVTEVKIDAPAATATHSKVNTETKSKIQLSSKKRETSVSTSAKDANPWLASKTMDSIETLDRKGHMHKKKV